MMKDPGSPEESEDHRQYVRLKSVCPVEFTIVRLQSDILGMDWQKGYTRNVSRGGLCLETEELRDTVIKYLKQQNLYLELRLHVPLTHAPIRAVAEVAWYRKVGEETANAYIIGLKFRSIVEKDLSRILGQARWLKFLIPAAVIVSVILSGALLIGTINTYKSGRAHKAVDHTLLKDYLKKIP